MRCQGQQAIALKTRIEQSATHHGRHFSQHLDLVIERHLKGQYIVRVDENRVVLKR